MSLGRPTDANDAVHILCATLGPCQKNDKGHVKQITTHKPYFSLPSVLIEDQPYGMEGAFKRQKVGWFLTKDYE